MENIGIKKYIFLDVIKDTSADDSNFLNYGMNFSHRFATMGLHLLTIIYIYYSISFNIYNNLYVDVFWFHQFMFFVTTILPS